MAVIVLLLRLTLVPFESELLVRFFIGTALIIVGLTFFLIGVDLGITPLGAMLGPLITKRNRLWIVILSGLFLGFIISFAEPGVMILATQIETVTSGAISSLIILIVVSVGIAVMLAFGFVRNLYKMPLYIILNICYGIVFILALFTSPEFLAISFDASGATTGILAVPFILSLSVGITMARRDSKASEKDSFGLVAIASVGAIVSLMLMDIFSGGKTFTGVLAVEQNETLTSVTVMINNLWEAIYESVVAFIPLLLIYVSIALLTYRTSKRELRRIAFGFLYAFLGMTLFFWGVKGGFMEVGILIGHHLTKFYPGYYLIVTGFVLGVVTILAEPAVHVLTHQIEEVTSGYVTKRAVLIALSLGVGIAVALSMIRILSPGVRLWYYLLPGYILCLVLTFIVPKLFVGIAFDAGGVATGPMTATFILAFTQGSASAYEGANLLQDGFGMIAMVAMLPIITLQLLGLAYKLKTRKRSVSGGEGS